MLSILCARVDESRFPLIDRFYSQCKYRVKCGRFDRIYAITQGQLIVAAARLMQQKSGHFLLRNVIVAPDYRGQGYATQLIHYLVTDVVPLNCYCYALPFLQDFYQSLNFCHLTPEQVPADVGEIYLRYRSRKRDWVLMGFINSDHKQIQLASNTSAEYSE